MVDFNKALQAQKIREEVINKLEESKCFLPNEIDGEFLENLIRSIDAIIYRHLI